MQISDIVSLWTPRKTILALAAALGLGGAIGSALAISPTVAPPIKWAGGEEFVGTVSGPTLIFTVPTGRSLLITDVVASNPNATPASFSLYTGGGDCGGILKIRIHSVTVPPNNVALISLQTGIGFGAGQPVCLAGSQPINFSVRGFLFTPLAS